LSFALLNQTFREIDRFKTAQDAAGWMSEKNFPAAAVNGIRDFLKLPHDTTRPSVASCVSNCLYFWPTDAGQKLWKIIPARWQTLPRPLAKFVCGTLASRPGSPSSRLYRQHDDKDDRKVFPPKNRSGAAFLSELVLTGYKH